MIGILASVIDGVLVGSVYGLAAMGLTLIWGVMNVINLAHGAIIVFGMFALYMLASVLGMPAYGAIPVVDRARLRVRRRALLDRCASHDRPPELMSLLATFAVNMMLIGLGTALWTTSPYNVPVSHARHDAAGRYTFTGTHIMAAVLAVVIAGLLYLLALPHAHRQGDPRRRQQSRGGRAHTAFPRRRCSRWPLVSASRSPACRAR